MEIEAWQVLVALAIAVVILLAIELGLINLIKKKSLFFWKARRLNQNMFLSTVTGLVHIAGMVEVGGIKMPIFREYGPHPVNIDLNDSNTHVYSFEQNLVGEPGGSLFVYDDLNHPSPLIANVSRKYNVLKDDYNRKVLENMKLKRQLKQEGQEDEISVDVIEAQKFGAIKRVLWPPMFIKNSPSRTGSFLPSEENI